MKYFNPIEREYVAPIDLEIANKSLETMEKGHLEAVKTASALKTAISQLDMHESQDDFKHGLLNEIQKTVNDNTLYGNSFAALDDLVAKQGELLSRADVKGRLDSNKDYKEWLTRLKNRNDLSEDYKQVFEEYNKYYYEDKYNDKGEIIGGTKWKPERDAVSEVPLDSAILAAIQIAATESGVGGNRWVFNSEGKIIANKDINDFVDTKAIESSDEFKKLGPGQYQMKTPTRMENAFNALVSSKPGLAQSIEQDWFVANVKRNKAIAEKQKNNDNTPYVSDITDANGGLISQEQWLHNRIWPAFLSASFVTYVPLTSGGGGRGGGGGGGAASVLNAAANLISHMTPRYYPQMGNEEIDNVEAGDPYTNAESARRSVLDQFGNTVTKEDVMATYPEMFSMFDRNVSQNYFYTSPKNYVEKPK